MAHLGIQKTSFPKQNEHSLCVPSLLTCVVEAAQSLQPTWATPKYQRKSICSKIVWWLQLHHRRSLSRARQQRNWEPVLNNFINVSLKIGVHNYCRNQGKIIFGGTYNGNKQLFSKEFQRPSERICAFELQSAIVRPQMEPSQFKRIKTMKWNQRSDILHDHINAVVHKILKSRSKSIDKNQLFWSHGIYKI